MFLKDILNPRIVFGGGGSGGGGGGGSERKRQPTRVQSTPAAKAPVTQRDDRTPAKTTTPAAAPVAQTAPTVQDTTSAAKETKAAPQVAQAAPAAKEAIVSDAPVPPKETKAAPVSVQPVAAPKGAGGNDSPQPIAAPEPVEGVNGASGSREGGNSGTSKASTIREENARARSLRDGQDPYQRGGQNRRKPSRGPNPFRIFNRR